MGGGGALKGLVHNMLMQFFTLDSSKIEAPKGLVHNMLMQFFTLDSSKIEVFESYFFDILIT